MSEDEIHPALTAQQRNRENQYYLYDPVLLARHLRARPKKEAYLYFPKKDDQVIENPKKPERTLRMIFTNVTFLEYEDMKLKEFYEKVEKNKSNPKKKLELPKWWNECDTRRFLQATSFNLDKSIEYIKKQIEWRRTFFPFTITDNIIKILNSGFMYIHGRDNHYRPIFVLQASTFFQLRKEYSFNEMFMAIVYFLEYVINNLLIRGQIENWTTITDVTGVSLVFMPSDLKKIIDILGSCYRCRLFRNYIIGMNPALRFIAKIFMSFLDQATVNKIRFLDSANMHSELTTFINEDNLEQKFGGRAQNITPGGNNVFPPVMPSDDISKPGDDLLISEEEYKEKCNGNDKPFVICEEFIEKWKKEEIEKEEEKIKQKEKNIITKSKTCIQLPELEVNEIRKSITVIKENLQVEHLVVRQENVNKEYTTKGRRGSCMKVSSILGMRNINNNTPDIFDKKIETDNSKEADSVQTDLHTRKGRQKIKI